MTPGETSTAALERLSAACLACVILILALPGYFLAAKDVQPRVLGILLLLSMAVSLLSLSCTALLDPGTLQPQAAADADALRVLTGEINAADVGIERDSHSGALRWPASAPRDTQRRYCTTCHIWRPPRATHCNTCGFCVQRCAPGFQFPYLL